MHYTSKDIIEEPDAIVSHVRICVGAAGQLAVLP